MGREEGRTKSCRGIRLMAAALAAGCLMAWVAAAEGAADTAAESPAGSSKPSAGTSTKSTGGAVKTDVLAPPAETPPVPTPAEPGTAPSTPGVMKTSPAGDGKIDFHMKNEDLNNVLELLSREYEVNIVASKSAKGKVTADLYKVTIDQVLDAICRANNLQWVKEGGQIYVQTPDEAKATRLDESRMKTEVFPLNFLTAEDASKLVTPAISAKATVAVNTPSEIGLPTGAGGSTGGNSFGLADSLVIRDYPENLEQVRDILKQMDRRPRQVLVEATILQVTLNDSTSLGVNFNTLAGIDFRDISSTMVPVHTPFAASPTTDPAIVTANAAQAVDGHLAPWGNAYTTGFATPGPGLNIGVMTNNVSVFINALESVTDTTVLSNPKVLALNKQRAEVMIGERFGYRTTTTTATTTVQTIEFLDTGTQMIFRPFISDDGYVRLEVHPKVSTGGVDAAGLPTEQTTEVTANIMVKDGHTVVIGGLFSENTSIAKSMIPGLGNIPLAGWLFRNNSDTTIRREIIILLTPHIIEDEAAANALGEGLRDDAKRRCLGMREGFTFFTRERITATFMEEADKAWQRYERTGSCLDRLGAWWNVNLTLNVSPNHLPALRLRDRVNSGRDRSPAGPGVWTFWNSVSDRMSEWDKAKAQAAAAQPKPAAVETPKDKPAATPANAPKDKAPAVPPPPAAPAKAAASEAAPADPNTPSTTAKAETVADEVTAAYDAEEVDDGE